MRDKERLYDFLMGLNDEYGAVKTQILSNNPLSTLGAAYHLVSQDEQQRHIGHSRHTNTEAAAFQTYGRNPPRQPGKLNAQRKDDRGKSSKANDRLCTHCHKSGHTVDGCFELIGYPEWWTVKMTKTQPTKAKPPPRAAAVTDENYTPSLTKDEYDRLMQMLRTTKLKETTPMANMAGLTHEEPDWDG